mmetsp:Transcript_32461/g.85451  ORF Transcript_32461/g.85451 Transcript_32461/m.85451 type:complete len:208 (+) Transcript_32461:599-1222(+)
MDDTALEDECATDGYASSFLGNTMVILVAVKIAVLDTGIADMRHLLALDVSLGVKVNIVAIAALVVVVLSFEGVKDDVTTSTALNVYLCFTIIASFTFFAVGLGVGPLLDDVIGGRFERPTQRAASRESAANRAISLAHAPTNGPTNIGTDGQQHIQGDHTLAGLSLMFVSVVPLWWCLGGALLLKDGSLFGMGLAYFPISKRNAST